MIFLKRFLSVPSAVLLSLVIMGCSSPPGRVGPTVSIEAIPAGEATLSPRVRVSTSMGEFEIELYAEKAPITVINFVDYVQAGYYNGTIFHSIIRNVAIQGGFYLPNLDKKIRGLRPAIPVETNNGLTNSKWMLGMFRQQHLHKSAKSQFYINMHENSDLDMPRDGAGYTVFAKVVEGFELLETMRDVNVGPHPKYASGQSPSVPVIPIVIQSMKMLSRLDRKAATIIAEENQRPQIQKADDIIQKYVEQSGNEVVYSPTGLIYIDLRKGHGGSPEAVETVEIFYRGTLVDGREFESALEDSLKVPVEGMISGLQEGILTMKEGGKRVLIIPPKLGYGEGGVPGRIPSDSVLIFELELLQIVPYDPKKFVPFNRLQN